MPRVAAINHRSRFGRAFSEEIPVPLGVNHLRAYAVRDSLPCRGNGGIQNLLDLDNERSQVRLTRLDTEVLLMALWVSYDGGATWEWGGHLGTTGGDVFVGPRGDLVIDSIYSTNLREPDNKFRLLKVQIENQERLKTKVDIEFDTLFSTSKVRDDHCSIAVVDAQTASTSSGTSWSTPSLNTVSADYLVAFSQNYKYGGPEDISSFTFGATGLSAKFSNDNLSHSKINGYELVSPSTTPAAISVTYAGNTGGTTGTVGFSGVDTVTPSDAPVARATGTSSGPAIISIPKGEDGDVRVAMFWNGLGLDPTFTVGANETDRCNLTLGTNPYKQALLVSTKEDNGTDDNN